MDALILNKLERVQAEDDEARKEELRQETAEELGNHFARHPMDMEELAYDLLNIAWADALKGDIVSQTIETKTVGLGEVDYIEEDLRGMRAYWQGKGGQIESDIIRTERKVMPREEIVAAIDLHRDEIKLDFWGSFAKLTSKAEEKMATLPTERLIELVAAGITTGDPTFGTFAANSMTDDNVDSVIEPVALKSGGTVTLLGTGVAVRKLANVGLDFGQNLQERIFDTGIIGRYKGYSVVQVENFEDFDGDFVIPNDEIWVVGKRAGRLTYYGADAKVQQLARSGFYLRWETARDAGMLLYGATKGRIGRIVLT